jgi:hypothetical protein
MYIGEKKMIDSIENLNIWKTNEGRVVYMCKKCGKTLVELPDVKYKRDLKSCRHFKWETRTYEQLPVIDSDVVLDIIKGKKVYVLKQR